MLNSWRIIDEKRLCNKVPTFGNKFPLIGKILHTTCLVRKTKKASESDTIDDCISPQRAPQLNRRKNAFNGAGKERREMILLFKKTKTLWTLWAWVSGTNGREDRDQKSEGREHRAEGNRAKGREHGAKGRDQRAGGMERRAESRGQRAIDDCISRINGSDLPDGWQAGLR